MYAVSRWKLLKICNAGRKNFFSIRVCDDWNRLPSDVKQCKNVKCFKKELRKFLDTNPAQAASTG